MKIQKWLRAGELETAELTTTEKLLEACGEPLDRASVWDILGQPVFVGEDGKTYVVQVEAVIDEASPEYAQAVLEELAENE